MTNHDKEKDGRLTKKAMEKILAVRHDNNITKSNAPKLYTMTTKYINFVSKVNNCIKINFNYGF